MHVCVLKEQKMLNISAGIGKEDAYQTLRKPVNKCGVAVNNTQVFKAHFTSKCATIFRTFIK